MGVRRKPSKSDFGYNSPQATPLPEANLMLAADQPSILFSWQGRQAALSLAEFQEVVLQMSVMLADAKAFWVVLCWAKKNLNWGENECSRYRRFCWQVRSKSEIPSSDIDAQVMAETIELFRRYLIKCLYYSEAQADRTIEEFKSQSNVA